MTWYGMGVARHADVACPAALALMPPAWLCERGSFDSRVLVEKKTSVACPAALAQLPPAGLGERGSCDFSRKDVLRPSVSLPSLGRL